MREKKGPRKYTRQPLIAEIKYVSASPVLSARISDISVGGLFIDTVNALELGRIVRFSLDLPGEGDLGPVTGEGVVTWTEQTVGMGLRFTKMSRADWERVKAFVGKKT